VTATEPTGFIGWTAQYGQYLGFYIQLVYYIALSFAAIWAAKTLSRYVKYMTTEDVEVVEYEEVDETEAAESDESDEKKSVEEFVE
jgi:hypothetical protein